MMSNANFNTVCANSNQLESASEIYAEQTYDINDVTSAEGYIYPILYPLPLYYEVYSAVTPVEYNGTTFYYYQQYAVPLYSYSYTDVMPDNPAVPEIYNVSFEDSTNELPEHESNNSYAHVTTDNSTVSEIYSVSSDDFTNEMTEQVTSELSLEDPADDVIPLNVEGEIENDDTSDKSEEILESAPRPDKISCTVEIDNRESDHKQVNEARMESSYDNMSENEAQNDLYQDIGQENEFCNDPYSDSFDKKDYNAESCHDDPIENEFGPAGNDSFDKEGYNTESGHGDLAENEFGTVSSDEDLDEIYSNSIRCSKLHLEDPVDEVIPLKAEEDKEEDDKSEISEQTLESATARLDKVSCTEKKEKWDDDNKEIDADTIVSPYDKLSDSDAQKNSYQDSGQEIEFCKDPFTDSFEDESFNIESCYSDIAENELRTVSSDDDIVEKNSNLQVRCGKVFKKLRHFKREIEVLPTIYEEDEPADGDEELPETSDEMASSQTSKKKRFKRLRRWFSRLTNCCRKSREDSPG